MDSKYFILILFSGYLNSIFCSGTEASTTEKQPQSTLFTSSMPYSSANVQNTTENLSDQPKQSITSVKVTAGQPTSAVHTPSGKPTKYTPARPLTYIITSQPTAVASTSFSQTASDMSTSTRQLPPSAHTSTRQPSTSSLSYTPTQQPSLPVDTSSRKSVLSTVGYLSIPSTPAVQNLPRTTPRFILETTPNKRISNNNNSITAILIGIILTSMLVAIIIIVLWKCLRKPVLNDQNWAGRSPFADGETPDICMDNIRENEVSTKRTSIVSLMTWKPSKSTLLADDLEIKLFQSSENIEDANDPKTEKIKDQVNGTSDDSADGSTIGTAVSSSDDFNQDFNLPPPTPLLDLEGRESNQSDKHVMTIVPPLPNDPTNFQPTLNSLNQDFEDHNSKTKQSFTSCPDSFNLPLPPEDFIKNQEDSNNEIQCQEFSILPDSNQDFNDSLPPPLAELL
ncbi:protein EVI2B [Marmota flaviventris]|uniref:protein EVI2B n=1 Tax=Marmota flaviventris TaxID=93162 RepID=UPI000FFFC066|nr:protein EVI2B [Marmota flaviventris]